MKSLRSEGEEGRQIKRAMYWVRQEMFAEQSAWELDNGNGQA
jgi:hypothetical protein